MKEKLESRKAELLKALEQLNNEGNKLVEQSKAINKRLAELKVIKDRIEGALAEFKLLEEDKPAAQVKDIKKEIKKQSPNKAVSVN